MTTIPVNRRHKWRRYVALAVSPFTAFSAALVVSLPFMAFPSGARRNLPIV